VSKNKESIKSGQFTNSDPAQKVEKEELDHLPSIFVSRERIDAICDEIKKSDDRNLPYASDHVLRGVIHLAALSIPEPMISRSLMIPLGRVKSMLASISVKQEVERIQVEHYQRDAQKMFGRLVPAAVNNIFDLMANLSHKESTRLDAAKYIVDRALGKPKEQMEVKTDLLADVFSQLHKKNQEAPKAMEAEFTSVDDALEAKDPLEKLLGKP
jgi:hypothetical protein